MPSTRRTHWSRDRLVVVLGVLVGVVLAVSLVLAALGLVAAMSTLDSHRDTLRQQQQQLTRQGRLIDQQQAQIRRSEDVIDHLRAYVAQATGNPDAPYLPGPH